MTQNNEINQTESIEKVNLITNLLSKTFVRTKEHTKLRHAIGLTFKIFVIFIVILGIINLILFALGLNTQTPWRHEVDGTSSYPGSTLYVALGYISIISATFGGVAMYIGNVYNLDLSYKFFLYISIFCFFSIINDLIISAWWLLITILIQWVIFYLRYLNWKGIALKEQEAKTNDKLIIELDKNQVVKKGLSNMNQKWWLVAVFSGIFYFILGTLLLVPNIFGYHDVTFTLIDGSTKTVESGLIYDSHPWLDITSGTLLIVGIVFASRKAWYGWIPYIIAQILIMTIFGLEHVWVMTAQYFFGLLVCILVLAMWIEKDISIKKDYKKFKSQLNTIYENDLTFDETKNKYQIDLDKLIKWTSINWEQFDKIYLIFKVKNKNNQSKTNDFFYAFVPTNVNNFLKKHCNIELKFEGLKQNKILSYYFKVNINGDNLNNIKKSEWQFIYELINKTQDNQFEIHFKLAGTIINKNEKIDLK